nr:MAG TPA: hypothetical protein [Caudoviricetes sp.]
MDRTGPIRPLPTVLTHWGYTISLPLRKEQI